MKVFCGHSLTGDESPRTFLLETGTLFNTSHVIHTHSARTSRYNIKNVTFTRNVSLHHCSVIENVTLPRYSLMGLASEYNSIRASLAVRYRAAEYMDSLTHLLGLTNAVA